MPRRIIRFMPKFVQKLRARPFFSIYLIVTLSSFFIIYASYQLALTFLASQVALILFAFTVITYVIWREKNIDRQWLAVTVAVAIVAIYFPTVVEKQNALEAVQAANRYNCSLAYNRDLELKQRITYGVGNEQFTNTFVLEPYVINLANFANRGDLATTTFELVGLLQAQNSLLAERHSFLNSYRISYKEDPNPEKGNSILLGFDLDYLMRHKQIATATNRVQVKFFGQKNSDCEAVQRFDSACDKQNGEQMCWSLTPGWVTNLPEDYYHL